MIKFTLLISILLYTISLLGQENQFNSKVFNNARPNTESYSNEKKNPKTLIYDFSQCENDAYEKCFEGIDKPKVFDFTDCEDKKDVRKKYFDNLRDFIYSNLDIKTFDYFNANLREKDSIYTLRFTYYRNNKGEVIPDLIGSNLKRSNYEAHKKLVFLLSKATLPKEKNTAQLKGKQDFVFMNLKLNSITNKLQLLPYKKRDEFEFNPSDSLTAPVYKGCTALEDLYSKKTYKTTKRCMAFHISNLVSENFDKEIQKKAAVILAKKYGLYNKKIKTIAKFVFNKEGKVVDIETLGLVPEIEDEVTKILSKIPNAQPGTKKGALVSVMYSIPVTIKTIER